MILRILLAGAILALPVSSRCQEEQSGAKANPSARFWTLPRVELNGAGETVLPQISRAPAGSMETNGAELAIENETLKVICQPESGRLRVLFKAASRTVLDEITDFVPPVANIKAGAVSVVDKAFGQGKAIEISYPNGDLDRVSLFPGLPFALFQTRLHNGGAEPIVVRGVRPFQSRVDLGRPGSQLKTLGTGGLLRPDANPGSYEWLAVVEPESRNGVVFGLLTHDRGDGVIFSRLEGGAVQVGAQIDYGRLRIGPGQDADLETLAVGYFDDARLGLEAWAGAIAKVYDIHLPPQPTGYCTWYSQPYGGASDENHLGAQAAFARTNLQPFGFSVIQIDDHWQAGIRADGPKRNFLAHDPNGPYQSGMKLAADNITGLGLVPGIWFLPFAGTLGDPLFKGHEDWFVKHEDGAPYTVKWGGTCLDMTYGPARDHLSNVVYRLSHEWGYKYFKIDGLWTGTATPINYVNSGYKEDHIGDAVFHDPDKSNIEAYRDGLKLIRAVAGPNVFILGCNGPQNMRSYGGAFGLLDGMRVGPDNGTDWAKLTRGIIFGSRHYFLNGRVWYNDPDPVYVRTNLPLNQAQLICSWVGLSGQMDLSSEWLPGLPPERLDILKRIMPYHGQVARPVDLFESDPPRVWLVSDTRASPRRDVIGLFNWSTNAQEFSYDLDRIGLDANATYEAFDYWQNSILPEIKGRLNITVPGQSCGVLALRAKSDHPLVLSTSRHVTQGMVEMTGEEWDEAARTLSGRSKVVERDPYELRIPSDTTRSTVEISAADRAAGVTATVTTDGKLLRARIQSPASREVTWTVRIPKEEMPIRLYGMILAGAIVVGLVIILGLRGRRGMA